MLRNAAVPAVLCLTLLGFVAGCGEDTPAADEPGTTASGSPTPSTDESTSASPEPSDSASSTPTGDEPPFPAEVAPDDGGNGSGNGLGVVDVRVGRHQGYDRVVFELDGTGEPGWLVEYVDDPRADGSGDPVELEGSAYLQVVLRGLGMPFETGIEELGPDRVPGAGAVTEVAPGGVFEGQQLAFIGLTGAERPFRVFALEDPTRVVVDVQTD